MHIIGFVCVTSGQACILCEAKFQIHHEVHTCQLAARMCVGPTNKVLVSLLSAAYTVSWLWVMISIVSCTVGLS